MPNISWYGGLLASIAYHRPSHLEGLLEGSPNLMYTSLRASFSQINKRLAVFLSVAELASSSSGLGVVPEHNNQTRSSK
jgi:hypothetical protein